jgi:hypothetical protein
MPSLSTHLALASHPPPDRTENVESVKLSLWSIVVGLACKVVIQPESRAADNAAAAGIVPDAPKTTTARDRFRNPWP